MEHVTYIGKRKDDASCVAFVLCENGLRRTLPARRDLFNHSPSGFEWGYGGSGPAQLALAVLADHFKRNPEDLGMFGRGARTIASWADVEALSLNCSLAEAMAIRYHQTFKFKVIANMPKDGFRLTSREVTDALTEIAKAGRMVL